MTTEEATARISAQIDDATRRAAADVVLDNDGDRGTLEAAVDALWADRLVPYERNVREKVVAPRPAIVHLVDYDPTWPAQYERLAARTCATTSATGASTTSARRPCPACRPRTSSTCSSRWSRSRRRTGSPTR